MPLKPAAGKKGSDDLGYALEDCQDSGKHAFSRSPCWTATRTRFKIVSHGVSLRCSARTAKESAMQYNLVSGDNHIDLTYCPQDLWSSQAPG